jgi:hypothetical protein
MKVTAMLLLGLVFIYYAQGAYQIDSNWQGSSFFNGWDFFTGNDPTHGTVDYVAQNVAQQKGYIAMQGNAAYIGCDMTSVVSTKVRGRQSVRLTSQKTFNSGLFIIDLTHMPTGCATWPAFWTVGPGWPNNGEIDIIEGINVMTVDHTTLHTNNGCTMEHESPSLFSGSFVSKNCYVNAPGQAANQGCSISAAANTYGAPFNSAGGGVYVTEWNSTVIRNYFFPRGRIPADISNKQPNPNGWGKPYAWFTLGGDCPASHFKNHQIVINLTFCGDWAGNAFNGDCSKFGNNCANFVRNSPTEFKEAYWLINYVSVYQNH